MVPRTDSSAVNRPVYSPCPVTRIALVPLTGCPSTGAPVAATHDGSRRGPAVSPQAVARTEAIVVVRAARRWDTQRGMRMREGEMRARQQPDAVVDMCAASAAATP